MWGGALGVGRGSRCGEGQSLLSKVSPLFSQEIKMTSEPFISALELYIR